jgi:hypothetical protein
MALTRRFSETTVQVLAFIALIAAVLPVESSPVVSPSTSYYSAPPPEYYSPPPPTYYSPPPPPPEYYSPPPPPTYYSPPPPPEYYSAPPTYYSPPPPPEYYAPPPTYYSPPPPPTYYTPPPTYYAPPPYYTKPEYYTKEYYPEYVNYDAVDYQELNVSIHCGLLPAVNSELYKGAYNPQDYEKSYTQYGTSLLVKDDVEAFGQYPWVVRITDDYNNYICAGVVVHNRQVLTLQSCIYGQPLEKLRVRYGDWDILNDVNEYEAYKNYETRICRVLPVTCPASYGYGQQSQYSGDLVLVQVDFIEDYDKYPQTKPICLPEWPYVPPPTYAPPPTYTPPPYNPPTYGYSQPVVAYSPPPPAYEPTYYQPEYYSDCWVEGYYASPTTELQNHQPPQGSDYSYSPKDYNPYSATYYPEQSKIPRRAQVKRIQSYSYAPPQYGYQQQCQDEEQQWIGVNGYDACVADKGSAIICIVNEHQGYAGYQSYDSSSSYGQTTYQQPPNYPAYQPYKQIKATPAPAKEARKRAVVVAIVTKLTQCTDYEQQYDQQQYAYGQDQSSNAYSKQQSKAITAIKVTSDSVNFIVDKFWEGALDYSCPAPKAYYPEPSYYPETAAPAYTAPAYTPSYAPPPYSPPPYTPPYYSAPPSYSPPPYVAPPSYSPPTPSYY